MISRFLTIGRNPISSEGGGETSQNKFTGREKRDRNATLGSQQRPLFCSIASSMHGLGGSRALRDPDIAGFTNPDPEPKFMIFFGVIWDPKCVWD
jgi:hypothetical protein